MKGKVIIFSAPSGSGKTTIIRHLTHKFPELKFSVSATTRPPRPGELNGRDYYFMTQEEFQKRQLENQFIESEEVYQGLFYGTLKSEIERLWSAGNHVLFDVDVEGGVNLKKYFNEQALSVFVRPPDVEVLAERLKARKSESQESLQQRIAKAEKELQYEKFFDKVLVNDRLEFTLPQAEQLISDFFNS